MHIADITMFYAPTSGGVRTYLQHKHRYLVNRGGIRHTVLVPARRRAQDGAFHYLPATSLGRTGYHFPLSIGPWVDCLCQLRPDLIEAGDPYRLAFAALKAGQRLGVPVVGFYHSDLPRLLRSRLGSAVGRIAEAYVRRLYARFQRVLAPSRTIARQLQALGLDNVTVQPLGVDVRLFHPAHADPNLRQRLGIAPDARLLVFAGRAAREKNIPLLLAALRALGPAYHLLLIGPSMPTVKQPNVTVVDGYMQAAGLAEHLAACDALIHAGDHETFGLIVLEAMACGLPIIGTRAGALPELVPPGTGVLTEQVSRDGLVDATRTLFSLDAAAMGRRARKQTEEHYAWERTLGGLLGHYRHLLNPAPAPASGASHAGD